MVVVLIDRATTGDEGSLVTTQTFCHCHFCLPLASLTLQQCRSCMLASLSLIHTISQILDMSSCFPLLDKIGDYLALTGSDAFKARTEASKLSAFFLVEMGATLNSVVHFWEYAASSVIVTNIIRFLTGASRIRYDDLDHRVRVRASLAGHKVCFVSVFSK